MKRDFLNIYCPSCGAPAYFDIVHQIYRCNSCGGEVKLEDAAREKKEFQEDVSQRVQQSAEGFALETVSCTGCGATLIFEENEALSKCEFCGRNLVREKYVTSSDAPQSVIPFALTQQDAEKRLEEWCSLNSDKKEAKKLKKIIPSIHGYYLPYRLAQGPCKSYVKARSGSVKFEMQGYLSNSFVNCSDQLDNLLLDAMEPYDLSSIKEFDFAYVAGHRVKVSDITEEETIERLTEETTENYRGKMEKIWKTKALTMETEVNPTVNLPVLLPVYYIVKDGIEAAVNGQTGKVSVRAIKESVYIDLPWWVKGFFVLLLAVFGTYYALDFGMKDSEAALYITGMLSIVYFVVFLCMFEQTDIFHRTIVKYRNLFTSGEATFKRERGKLVMREEVLEREIAEPVFFREIGGKQTRVAYSFRSAKQILSMIAMTLGVIFLPIILALFINGFDVSRLQISGSAVWLCIAVPTAPIYFIKFGIQMLYDRPWIYTYAESGKLKRYRLSFGEVWSCIKKAFKYMRVPGVCVGVLIALGVLAIMVYATAFGFLE